MAVETTPRLGLKKYTSGNDLHPNRTEFNAMQDQMERLVAIADKGTTAQRPSAGKVGRFYWSEDAARLYYDDGKQWLDVNPNGGGGAGTTITVAGTAEEGTSARSARADHTHNLPLATGSAHGGMSKTDKAKLDAATATGTANTLVQRNGSGQVSVGAPGSETHAATKGYVDTEVGKKSDLGHKHNADDVNAGVLAPARLPAATQSAQGALSAADKKKLDGATDAVMANQLVSRDAGGRVRMTTPTDGMHAANKDYVDALAAERVEYMGDIGTGSIDKVVARGVYTQPQAGPVTTANGYPIDGPAGTLVVLPFGGTAYLLQEWTQWSSPRRWLRSTNNTGTTWTAWIEQASTARATGSADGLMSSVDKAKLDKATSSPTASALALRDSNGDTGFNAVALAETTAAGHAARKDYVDKQVATRAPLAHSHQLSDVTVNYLSAGTNLDTIKTQGIYHQNQNANATLALNYPVAYAGLLEVLTPDTNFIYQRYTAYKSANKVWTRSYYSNAWSGWQELSTTDHTHNGADITSGTISPDRIANATASLDGLMPKADKDKLNKATSGTTGGTLVQRADNGQFQLPDPTSPTHAANMRYVDAQVATRAAASHSHGVGDLPKASATSDGLISKADKALLDAATYLPTNGTIVRRHSTAGTIHVETGDGAKDAANKGYVDAEVAKKANSSHKHAVGDLNPGNLSMTHLRLSSTTDASETSTGHAFQIGADSGTNLAMDNNEILVRNNGKLDVLHVNGGIASLPTPTTPTQATNKTYVDGQMQKAIDDAVAKALANTQDRGVRSRWTSGFTEPANSGKLATFDLATINIPDPGYPYHVSAEATCEAGGGGAGTRWDMFLTINGTSVDNARGDAVAPWFKVAGGTGGTRTGALTVTLKVNRVNGSGNFGLSNYNRFFHVMMHPAHPEG